MFDFATAKNNELILWRGLEISNGTLRFECMRAKNTLAEGGK